LFATYESAHRILSKMTQMEMNDAPSSIRSEPFSSMPAWPELMTNYSSSSFALSTPLETAEIERQKGTEENDIVIERDIDIKAGETGVEKGKEKNNDKERADL